MIRPAEIQKKANKERVRETQIEKDYILTWILSGVANNGVLSKARHKGLDPDSLQEKLEGKVGVFKSRWDSSMKDQIAELPPFEQVHRELGKHFRAFFKC